MEGLWGLVFCLVCMTEAILVNNKGAGDFNNTYKQDQLITQESQVKRSAYGGYYPEDHGYNYGYGYDHDHGHGVDYYPHHHPDHHPHHHHHYDTLKALLIPLAGVALLGAAAVFASNPVLLQLGVVQGRRRREADGRLQDLLALEKFMSHLPAGEVEKQNRRLIAQYLSCGGGCVLRVACEVHRYGVPEDIHVMDMVISEIQQNEFISEKVKNSITKARKHGRTKGSCKEYSCLELDNLLKSKD